ncbi:PXDN [Lepeophtheirus salmonis]|uniref:PXDN n=1 Tax=Lepeophtheirus salmonis TaxID=72036 RepID=A0A7R8CPM1_LEPSM|nr:PXDN [Lepeophtheirus salmonis]CAF2887575.1 PXDN [Lepeophtheirus salmonis]
MESLENRRDIADPKSPIGSSYGFLKPKAQSIEISNSSFVLQYASRRFLNNLLDGNDATQIVNLRMLNLEIEGLCDEQTLPCDHTTKYRTLTGWCNNLLFPRIWKIYTSRSVTGSPLPSPRLVSVNIHNDVSTPHVRYSLMMMQWGQFVDHDITHTPVNSGFADSILECKDCDAASRIHPECLPIPVPKGDPFYPSINITTGKPFCLAFTRSMPGQLTLGFREQMNQITSFADGSNVMDLICDLLPLTTENKECKSESGYCFEAGDARNSEQPLLTSLHTLFMREHNRIADELIRLNPQWSDDKLFHEARRIASSIQQHITWNEFLPRVLGWNAVNLYELGLLPEGYYRSYDEKFLIKPKFKRMNNQYSEKGRPLKLADMFFNPDKLHEPGMMDDLIRGVSSTSMETLDQFITDEVTNHLFEDKNTPYSGLDLASLNIQRGRDHGIPGYNLYRSICNLTRAQSFKDLQREIALPVVERLERTYAHVDDIDLFTGGLAETALHGGLVGPTFACIIGIQFRNLRKCDRFWYEGGNPLTRFTETQLAEIRKVTLSKVLCDTTDDITTIQRAIFDIPDPFLNPRISCQSLPSLDLDLWKERVMCKVGDIHIDTGDARRVSPCVMCTCTKEGPLCQSLKIENCFHLAQSFSPKAILEDHVCKVQCAFAFRGHFPL